jgi:hypothetical protein
MAFVHGKNAYFAVDDTGGVLRNLSTFLDSVSGLPGAVSLSEVTAFGDGGTKHIPGLENVSFSIAGHWDPTTTTGPHAVLSGISRGTNGPYTFEYSPQGNSAGNELLSGECWCTGYEAGAAVADKVSFSAEFQVNGIVNFGTIT